MFLFSCDVLRSGGRSPYLTSLLPVKRVTIYDRRQDPGYTVAQLDVDELHSILREAEGGYPQRLFAVYRDLILSDSHSQTEFSKRKLAVLGDVLNCLAEDKKNANDVAAAKFCDDQVNEISDWIFICSHLMDSTIWPVSVVEKVYRANGTGYEIAELVPVDYQLLDYSTGKLMIKDTDPKTGTVLGTMHAPDKTRYIIHRGHLLTTADNWGGPLRSILFWWLLGTMDRDWWARFLDRFGSPFMVGKYEQSDDQSRSTMERAFSMAVKVGGLVVSKETDVEIKQAATQSAGEAFEKFHAIAQREKSKLILGQTLSADAQSTGMGSGVADAQMEVRGDIRNFDARMLGQTIRTQLFKQLVWINGMPGKPPKAVWGSESAADVTAVGKLLESLFKSGLTIDDSSLESLSERVGLTIQRMPTPAAGVSPFSLYALDAGQPGRAELADRANESIAREGAADLARAFRGSLAPVRQIVLSSTSAEDLKEKLETFYADWSPAQTAVVLEKALVAFAANGAAR